jgi:hypothetical protein
MAKLKCVKCGRRVWVFGGEVHHRTGTPSRCAFPVTYAGVKFEEGDRIGDTEGSRFTVGRRGIIKQEGR